MAKMACDDDLALKLDEEFDEYMEAVIQKNKGYRYDGGFTAENFDEVR